MPHDNLIEILLPPVVISGYLFRIEPREYASLRDEVRRMGILAAPTHGRPGGEAHD
jgi:hypothetical protein